MRVDTETLIATLAQDGAKARPSPPPLMLMLQWLAVSAAYAGALLAYLGLRDDLAERFTDPLFLAETGLLLAVVLSTAFSACVLSFPDLYQTRKAAWLPALPLALFLVTLLLEWQADDPPAPAPLHGFDCLLCITLLGLLPMAWMLRRLRRQAVTHARAAGALALLAASALGCLALRLSEETDSVAHLALWHYLPMFLFGAIGLWAGRKCLKW